MGQVYSIEIDARFADEKAKRKFCQIASREISKKIEKGYNFCEYGEYDLDTPFGCFQTICPLAVELNGLWLADFYAGYGWESCMIDIFSKAFDALDNGSYMEMYLDESVNAIRKVDGETIVG